jgi:hypothetical protein
MEQRVTSPRGANDQRPFAIATPQLLEELNGLRISIAFFGAIHHERATKQHPLRPNRQHDLEEQAKPIEQTQRWNSGHHLFTAFKRVSCH